MNLSELEKDKIRGFLADDVMREAVKKVLLSITELDYKDQADRLSDLELGQVVRGSVQGKVFVEQGFEKLLDYQKAETPSKKVNKAL